MTNAPMRRWIGYDWFKLIVAIILALLLLVFWLRDSAAPATISVPIAVAPAAAVPTVVVPAAALPTAMAPAAVAPTAMAPAAAVPTLASIGVAPLTAPILISPIAGAQAAPGAITFSGTAQPNAMVQVLVDGKPIGKIKAGADGTWSLPAVIETPGNHAIIVQTLNDSGAIAASASPATISLAAPAAQIAVPVLNLPASPIAAGPLTLSGTGTPNSQIEVLVDGQSIGKATVGADGTWSLDTTLATGDHAISTRALDDKGAVAAEAAPISVTVAAATALAPASTALGISSPAEGAQLPSGAFTMSGTGTPSSMIEILDSDKVIGTVKVAADGTWSLPITPSDGTAAYSTRPAGSTADATRPIRVTIGTPALATCASLAVDCDAWVTRARGLSLRMRAGAGTGQAIIEKLPVGTQMKLLEGPQAANGYTWWHVRTLAGKEGWVAGEELRLQPD